MRSTVMTNPTHSLSALCSEVRTLVADGKHKECIPLIAQAMDEYPHNPEPHNLMGIVLEQMGDHRTAMKHFRAAWALDSTYLPAIQNLNNLGTFYSKGSCAYDDSDCKQDCSHHCEIAYNDHGIGHVIRRR